MTGGDVLLTFFGALITPAALGVRQGYVAIRNRSIRTFWRPFVGKPMSIVVTEYRLQGGDELSRIAQVAGTGRLISKGMALALAHILEFCSTRVTSRENIDICGGSSSSETKDNVVVCGGPASNPHAQSLYDRLAELYELPFEFAYADPTRMSISCAESGRVFTPSVREGFGHDYGVVIRAPYQQNPVKHAVLVSGCFMWGTSAAAKAITDPSILNHVYRESDRSQAMAFLIKTRVVNGVAGGPELEIENESLCFALKPKRASKPSGHPVPIGDALPDESGA